MEIELNILVKLFAPFYTEAGKKLAMELVKIDIVNPDAIFKLPPASRYEKESEGHWEEKIEQAVELFNEAALGMVDPETRLKLEKIARKEAKPDLFELDRESIWSAIEADQFYQYK